MTSSGMIFVVDDDEAVRRSLVRLIRSAGRTVEAFGSADDFLAAAPHDRPACLVLDVHLPGLSGLDLQKALTRDGDAMPVVFITGQGSIPMSVEAMKGGAVDFLPKPVEDEVLLDAIRRAVERDAELIGARAATAGIQARIDALTPRERQVFALVADGLPNKRVGAELGITEKTVKVHRARVMTKMQASSLADLVKLAQRARGSERRADQEI